MADRTKTGGTRRWTRWALPAILALSAGAACGDDGDDETGDGAADLATESGPPGWPHLGLDLDHSRAAHDEQLIGPENVADLEPVWELADVDGVTGTPIVADGVLYIGDWTGRLRALDPETGDELWAQSIDDRHIQSSVAVDDTRVFAGTFGATFAALERDTGDILWEKRLDDHPFASIFGSPIYFDGLVIVGVGSYENMISSGEDAYFRGSLVALDPETGDERWRYWTTTGDDEEGAGVGIWSTPAIDPDRGVLYVGTGQHHVEPTSDRSDAVIALDIETGEERWIHQYTEGDVWTAADGGTDADIGAPPNLFRVDGTDAVGAGDKDGVYKALDRDTGEELWSRNLTDGSLQGGVMASAAVADERIFVASNQAGRDALLFALDIDTGDVLWEIEVGGGMQGPVTWANDVVYTADNRGAISAFAAEDGDLLWSHQAGYQAAGGIAVVDGVVYAGYGWWLVGPADDQSGGLIAFRPTGSSDGPGDEATVAVDGATVYRQSCATCHGSDLEGGSGPALAGTGDRLTPDELEEVIREGRGEMPGWEDSLTDEEIESVRDYVGSR